MEVKRDIKDINLFLPDITIDFAGMTSERCEVLSKDSGICVTYPTPEKVVHDVLYLLYDIMRRDTHNNYAYLKVGTITFNLFVEILDDNLERLEEVLLVFTDADIKRVKYLDTVDTVTGKNKIRDESEIKDYFRNLFEPLFLENRHFIIDVLTQLLVEDII